MKKTKILSLILFCVAIIDYKAFGLATEAFVAEATEIIGVVRLGVSLVQYTYKVFSTIFEDSGISDSDLLGAEGRNVEKELLMEYKVITTALDRLGQSNEQVEVTIRQLRRNLPSIIRSVL